MWKKNFIDGLTVDCISPWNDDYYTKHVLGNEGTDCGTCDGGACEYCTHVVSDPYLLYDSEYYPSVHLPSTDTDINNYDLADWAHKCLAPLNVVNYIREHTYKKCGSQWQIDSRKTDLPNIYEIRGYRPALYEELVKKYPELKIEEEQDTTNENEKDEEFTKRIGNFELLKYCGHKGLGGKFNTKLSFDNHILDAIVIAYPPIPDVTDVWEYEVYIDSRNGITPKAISLFGGHFEQDRFGNFSIMRRFTEIEMDSIFDYFIHEPSECMEDLIYVSMDPFRNSKEYCVYLNTGTEEEEYTVEGYHMAYLKNMHNPDTGEAITSLSIDIRKATGSLEKFSYDPDYHGTFVSWRLGVRKDALL